MYNLFGIPFNDNGKRINVSECVDVAVRCKLKSEGVIIHMMASQIKMGKRVHGKWLRSGIRQVKAKSFWFNGGCNHVCGRYGVCLE